MANASWRRMPGQTRGSGPSFEKAPGKKMWTPTGRGFYFYSKVVKPKRDSRGDEYTQDQEVGPDISIHFPLSAQPGTNTYVLDLTDLTYDEYVNLRKILATALKEAEPIIKMRDADAARTLQSGGIAAPRAYRSVSRLFTPEGEVE